MLILDDRIYSKFLVKILYILFIINISALLLSINDIIYFRKILSGNSVQECENLFFDKKTDVIFWFKGIAYAIHLVIFLIWFYLSYKKVYDLNKSEAPFKPLLVPFSYIIPILNLFAPYRIMKFIWDSNIYDEHENRNGHKMINFWWFLTILSFSVSRMAKGQYSQAEYADEFLMATYFYIFYYILVCHLNIVTINIVRQIGSNRKRLKQSLHKT